MYSFTWGAIGAVIAAPLFICGISYELPWGDNVIGRFLIYASLWVAAVFLVLFLLGLIIYIFYHFTFLVLLAIFIVIAICCGGGYYVVRIHIDKY